MTCPAHYITASLLAGGPETSRHYTVVPPPDAHIINKNGDVNGVEAALAYDTPVNARMGH